MTKHLTTVWMSEWMGQTIVWLNLTENVRLNREKMPKKDRPLKSDTHSLSDCYAML